MAETRRRSLIAVLVVICLATASVAALAHHHGRPHGQGTLRFGARGASWHSAQEIVAAGLPGPPPAVVLALIGTVAEAATASSRVVAVSTASPRAPPFA